MKDVGTRFCVCFVSLGDFVYVAFVLHHVFPCFFGWVMIEGALRRTYSTASFRVYLLLSVTVLCISYGSDFLDRGTKLILILEKEILVKTPVVCSFKLQKQEETKLNDNFCIKSNPLYNLGIGKRLRIKMARPIIYIRSYIKKKKIWLHCSFNLFDCVQYV